MKDLRDAVIVITGASSGIGRATAFEAARRGAHVVLAARDQGALEEVAAACGRHGVRALPVSTDVTDLDAVEALARRADEVFGKIDVWVNDAAVTMFGALDEAPFEPWRRVIETNVLGYAHGARAVIPIFKRQGRGVLINVSSVAGVVGQPLTSAYTTSKFAIRGLSESLRQELRGTGIDVVTVLPASIDTPIFQHGANYTGRMPVPLTPILRAERVARAILRAAVKPRREVIVGNQGRWVAILRAIAPGLVERQTEKKVKQEHISDVPAPDSQGNVFQPSGFELVSGGWGGGGGGLPARALALGVLAGLAWALWRVAPSRQATACPPSTPRGRAVGRLLRR